MLPNTVSIIYLAIIFNLKIFFCKQSAVRRPPNESVIFYRIVHKVHVLRVDYCLVSFSTLPSLYSRCSDPLLMLIMLSLTTGKGVYTCTYGQWAYWTV